MVSSSDTIVQNIKDAIISKISSLISTHNSSSSAHSQGSANGNKNVVTNSSGYLTTEDKPVLVYQNGVLNNLNMAGANTVDVIITYDDNSTETMTLVEMSSIGS